MRILIVGGAFQGKYVFAKTFDMPVINNLHLIVRQMMEEMSDSEDLKDSIKEIIHEKILNIAKKSSGVIVSDEIGCGIIPAEKFERDYRELTGRILCEIAKRADEVYKVEAGIATNIKGPRII